MLGNNGGNWQRGHLIGVGSFGRVYLATETETGRVFAVKTAEASGNENVLTLSKRRYTQLSALENEIDVLSKVRSPFIVKFLGDDWSLEDGKKMRNLHMEYVSGGSLAKLVQETGPLPEAVIQPFVRDIVSGLADIHRCGFVHGDVKGHNILLHENGVKLGDFGAAWKGGGTVETAESLHTISVDNGSLQTVNTKSAICRPYPEDCGNSSHFMRGTLQWMSPEVVRGEQMQGPASDIWSLGCTIIEMATGHPAWREITGGTLSIVYALGCTDKTPALPKSLSPDAIHFLNCCLCHGVNDRWAASKLLQHPFLSTTKIGPSEHRLLQLSNSITSRVYPNPLTPLSPTSALCFPASPKLCHSDPLHRKMPSLQSKSTLGPASGCRSMAGKKRRRMNTMEESTCFDTPSIRSPCYHKINAEDKSPDFSARTFSADDSGQCAARTLFFPSAASPIDESIVECNRVHSEEFEFPTVSDSFNQPLVSAIQLLEMGLPSADSPIRDDSVCNSGAHDPKLNIKAQTSTGSAKTNVQKWLTVLEPPPSSWIVVRTQAAYGKCSCRKPPK